MWSKIFNCCLQKPWFPVQKLNTFPSSSSPPRKNFKPSLPPSPRPRKNFKPPFSKIVENFFTTPSPPILARGRGSLIVNNCLLSCSGGKPVLLFVLFNIFNSKIWKWQYISGSYSSLLKFESLSLLENYIR